MTSDTWKRLIKYALITAGLDILFGFQLVFAPGWANQWPFGLSMYVVWSTGMALLVFVLLMALAVAFGAFVAHACTSTPSRYATLLYVVWLLMAAALIHILCVWVYQDAHADALKMWPNSYPPSRQRQVGP